MFVCVCKCVLQHTKTTTPAYSFHLLPSQFVDSQINNGLPPSEEHSDVALQRETQFGHEAQGRHDLFSMRRVCLHFI